MMNAKKRDVRLLVVEDNDTFAMLIRAMLRRTASRPFHVEPVATLRAALKRMTRTRYDAVLLDLNLPDSHGTDTLSTFVETHHQIPVIVLTALDDEDLALQTIRLGAQDFLTKGNFDGNDLWRAICYGMERHRLRLALEEASRKAQDGTGSTEVAT